jgi:hypothetical protein
MTPDRERAFNERLAMLVLSYWIGRDSPILPRLRVEPQHGVRIHEASHDSHVYGVRSDMIDGLPRKATT